MRSRRYDLGSLSTLSEENEVDVVEKSTEKKKELKRRTRSFDPGLGLRSEDGRGRLKIVHQTFRFSFVVLPLGQDTRHAGD